MKFRNNRNMSLYYDLVDLSDITEEERDTILSVISRDEILREADYRRVRKLESEEKVVEPQKYLKPKQNEGSRACQKCEEALGVLLNRGENCPVCRCLVCNFCRERVSIKGKYKWICRQCYKQRQFDAKSGRWFYSKLIQVPVDPKTNRPVSSSELVKTLLNKSNTQKLNENHQMNGAATVTDELKRALATVSGGSESPSPQPSPSPSNRLTSTNVAFPKDSDKQKLGYLLRTASAGSSITSSTAGEEETVTRRKIGRRKSSTSSEEDISIASRSSKDSFQKQVLTYSNQVPSEKSQTSIPIIQLQEENPATKTPPPSPNLRNPSSTPTSPATPRQIQRIHPKASPNLLNPLSGSSESITSYYSDVGDGNCKKVSTVTGEIQLALEYDAKSTSLLVLIRKCKDLAAADLKKNRTDPYVKTYLLPDRSRAAKRKTHIRKSTFNPSFDQTLKYCGFTKGELSTRKLAVTVWHADSFGRNTFLGQVLLNLDAASLDQMAKWYKLQDKTAILGPNSPSLFYRGDLKVALKFLTTAKQTQGNARGELHVVVKGAFNLIPAKSNGTSDAFCKAYLLPRGRHSIKQKTPIVKGTTSPSWNHTLTFADICLEDLKQRALELTIWHHDKFSSNDFLGGVRLSLSQDDVEYGADWMDGKGEEVMLWQSVIDRPNSWIDASVALRDHMDSRNKKN